MTHPHGRFRTARASRLAVAGFCALLLAGSVALALPASNRPPQRFDTFDATVGVPTGWGLQPGIGPTPRRPGTDGTPPPRAQTLVDPQRPSRELRILPLQLNSATAAALDDAGRALAPDRVLRQTFHMLTGVRLPTSAQIDTLPLEGLRAATFLGRFARPVLAVDPDTGRARPTQEIGLTAVAILNAPDATDTLTALVLADRVFSWEDPNHRLQQHARSFEQILRQTRPR